MPSTDDEFPFRSPRHAVGIDLVTVAEVARSVATFGGRYVNRLYTADEIRYCFGGAAPGVVAERLAARFAAKEATFKLLRWGNRPTNWRAVEVRRSSGGWCTLQLHDEVRRIAECAGYSEFNVSLTHDGGLAAAVVTAWRVT
jgi:holo-[acyl-carrier protein] synthase